MEPGNRYMEAVSDDHDIASMINYPEIALKEPI
jgi:hypothetical protein